MTQDPTPEARALVEWWWNQATSAWSDWTDPQGVTALARAIDQHTAAAVLAEREACEKLCDEWDDGGGAGESWGPRFAAAIRARTPPAGRGTR